jgi:two-component system CheB/CheR fusion protein
MHELAPPPSTPPSNANVIPSKILFPVVGIGASAGGLEALLRLFENMPCNNSMAFVVVLHLSPQHQSIADQLLQRVTSMPVTQVVQPTLIEAGHVYVIAPSKQLSMIDGFLSVNELERPRGAHIAIDIFFRTLAEVHGERSIAMVLSGTGSDGAVGLTRIKEQGGITIVQEPGDAEHDGMPQAAIRTGIVDFVLPVGDMPQKLMELWQNARQIELPATGDGEAPVAHLVDGADVADAEQALQKIIISLLTHTGHDFRHYKRATVLRRIERRMQVRAVHTLPDYLSLLESDDSEHKMLLSDMLISVTNFFRDREAFEAVEREVIPDLFKDKAEGDEVRVWVTACSTGEEAYSIAILLADQAAQMSKPPAFQVFASDIDVEAINHARSGRYPASIITDVPPVRLRQHFSNDTDRYRIRKVVRDRILFTEHNLLRDPPFSRLDMVSCRNLLIYLNRDIQAKVLEMFHFALKPGGYLFLGNSESADSVSQFFAPVDKKNRIYRARLTARGSSSHGYMAVGPKRVGEIPVRKSTQSQFSYGDVHLRALAQLAPPSLVLDRESNIVHSSSGATRFLRMAGGEPSRSVLNLIVPEMRLELRSAIFQAQQSNSTVTCRPVAVPGQDGDSTFAISVKPFSDDDSAAEFMLVMFNEVVKAGDDDDTDRAIETGHVVLSQLEAELQHKKEQLQDTIEQAEVSTEELRASNEELQAINEELRSATEELETSKEELQSLNEELITVNYELKVKVEETGKANDDLNNLIAATDIATVFVDSGLRIKRFTPRAADIFSIISSDIGRSLLDLTHRLDYPELADDVSMSFDSLQVVEREVRSNDGRCFIARLLPYRTTEDRIEGAVLTFFDISARRHAEERLQARETRMRLVAESTRDYAIITTDAHGRVLSWNKGAELVFGYTEEEMTGHDLDPIYSPEDLLNHVRQDEMRRAREEGRAEDERWHMRKDGRQVFCTGVTTPLGPSASYGYAKIARNETARELSKCQLDQKLTIEQKSRSEAENEMAMKDEFLAIMSHELRHPLNVIHVNTELLARLPEVLRSSSASHATRQVRTAVISQAKIIEDLLDMSRVRTGKLALAAAPVDINALVSTLADVVRADHAANGLKISVTAPDEPVIVFADPVRIEQVFMNLLSNAVKFSCTEGVIEVSVSKEGDEAQIEVSDSGQGISADFLPQVFDMFGQAGSVTTRSKGGLGIGLALVREIVHLHGGHVHAHSEGIGMGARFRVCLPLYKNANLLAAANDGDAERRIEGARVLLVDDAEDLVVAFKSLLELEGAQVIVATDAAEALTVLEKNEIDIVVSDISMPEMDGYAFLEAARQMRGYDHLPAVALSGLAREADLKRAREAGFAAHLTKPVAIDKLIATMCELLEGAPS